MTTSNKIKNHLQSMTNPTLSDELERQNPNREQLVFDPATGELVVLRADQPSSTGPDAVVIDQIAEDGFFATDAPRVLVQASELAAILERRTAQSGLAFAMDDATVFHAFANAPAARPSGAAWPCIFVAAPSADAMATVDARIDEIQQSLNRQLDAPAAPVGVIVFVTRGPNNFICRAFAGEAGAMAECTVDVVPAASEIFSRNRGILETDVLATKKVAIVGLGSGGSQICVELARAGVGHFVLFDFDRLELSNISRHVCGTRDLGRLKTRAMRDDILQRNPSATVEIHNIDINTESTAFDQAIASVDLIIGATDNNRSRFNINAAALKHQIVALFGRATTRAAGGDVVRVRPSDGPCLACIFSKGLMQAADEERSQFRQARSETPAYVSDTDVAATIQPGLSIDIAPIANMTARLAIVELSRGGQAAMLHLEEDLQADFYIWANRRERIYASYAPMAYDFRSNTILRWYGARVSRNAECPVCAPVQAFDFDSLITERSH